ncbi:ribosome biogenesis protein bop1 isoform X2 [Salvelinus sp. IW2-2015]|uniref:ribosome biogenesis protein bop1 isoform X2 n=1 Tax=Salvelinus sp. IW2-2015 TaxID=2691554 RepID=UPI000CDF74FA|nr:ribosome biogenesis protein bop1 isoform X2 [Salvelinus alpinus]
MPTVTLESQKNGTMNKAKVKSAKKRVAEEDNDQLPIFDKDVTEKAGEEGDEDLSDSEESVFSGLEDSGSDIDEEEEDDGDDEEEDEDDAALILDENLKNSSGAETSAEPAEPKQGKKTASKETRKMKKGKGGAIDGRGEKGLTTTFQGLATAQQGDEYEHDTSDEEDIRNTVGNVPMEWYQDYPHIGYNLDGKKIFKPIRSKDELDEFLDKMENPDYWRTVHDKTTASDIRLTDEQVDLVHRLQKGQFGDVNFNEYESSVDFFTNEVMIHPVTNRPQDKRSFIPSLIEKEKVSKLVHAIKMGWIKPRKPKERTPQYYDLWAKEDPNAILGRHKMHVPAPKMRLPGHEESYNPPPEYLLTEEERLAWEQQDAEDRKLPFLPQKHSCLRAVPAFSRFIHERFERCLDLYLCPRQRKMRVNVNPEDLIPKLPKPKDLQPFPTTMSLVYRGHTSLVRSISASPTGQWLVSGSDDFTVRFWEVNTGRCMKTLEVGGAVKSVAWNPNPAVCLVAVCL